MEPGARGMEVGSGVACIRPCPWSPEWSGTLRLVAKKPITEDTLVTDDPYCPEPPPHDKGREEQANRCNRHDWAYALWLDNLEDSLAK